MNLFDRWQAQLRRLDAECRLRSLQTPFGHDFSSNDYLGYSKRVWPAAPLSRSGTASRLLRGHHVIWEEVESRLARWHRAQAVLLMNSGYGANEGLLSSVIETGDLVFSDQCNHASIIDGLRLSRAEKVVFPHNDVSTLQSLMHAAAAKRSARHEWFVVTESLFGMEGDLAPLLALAELTDRFGAHLIVDEAHATGCFGPQGSGIVDSLGLRERLLATVHTGGKALAVPGAYIVGSNLLKQMLVNRCRHLVFTTALPPQIGAWWLDALTAVQGDDATRQALKDRTSQFRADLTAHNIAAAGDDYIVPVVLGADRAAMAVAERLQAAGFDVRAIRPPTVPEGTARVRVSIHADHEPKLLAKLAAALATEWPAGAG